MEAEGSSQRSQLTSTVFSLHIQFIASPKGEAINECAQGWMPNF